uniref:Uncharacterized protein n=1 Tax=Cannabis sativa TaxID=3483 RepID=A0A803QJK5_CANSA
MAGDSFFSTGLRSNTRRFIREGWDNNIIILSSSSPLEHAPNRVSNLGSLFDERHFNADSGCGGGHAWFLDNNASVKRPGAVETGGGGTSGWAMPFPLSVWVITEVTMTGEGKKVEKAIFNLGGGLGNVTESNVHSSPERLSDINKDTNPEKRVETFKQRERVNFNEVLEFISNELRVGKIFGQKGLCELGSKKEEIRIDQDFEDKVVGISGMFRVKGNMIEDMDKVLFIRDDIHIGSKTTSFIISMRVHGLAYGCCRPCNAKGLQ